MRCFALMLLFVATYSCSKSDHTLARFHEDGRAKPSIAIAPLIDATSFEASWSLSEELTSLIVQNIAKDRGLFVSSKDDSNYTDNPFGKDLAWMKRSFSDHQFVVFLELVEHGYLSQAKNQKKVHDLIPFEASSNLLSALRIRVVDLREGTPKIILQELIKDSYYIPKNMPPTDYQRTPWGTESYLASPMGLAHKTLAEEVSSRIHDYVHLAKSR